ncbi:MAG: hypothetical protein U0234_00550 [Sandaracinus sp.]
MTHERPDAPHRIERTELYAAVWEEPATRVAARYSITSTALAKICRKLRVPTPPRGYWAKRAAGQRVARAALPRLVPGQKTVHVITSPATPQPPRDGVVEPTVVVPDVVDELHPMLKRFESRLRRRRDKNIWAETSCVDIRVSPELLDRALRIMHALLTALSSCGIEVEVTPPSETTSGAIEPSSTVATIDGVRLRFGLLEELRWERPELPPSTSRLRPVWPATDASAEIAAIERRLRERVEPPPAKQVPTGVLCIWIDAGIYLHAPVRRHVRDTKRSSLESRLGEVVVQLQAVARAVREQRARDAEAARQREIDRERWAIEERAREREKRLREDLLARYDAFSGVEKILALVHAVEACADATPSSLAWAAWARGRADVVRASALAVSQVWDTA